MRTVIEMPREHYDIFAAELDITSREYSILKNNIAVGGPETGPARTTLEIICDDDEAELLLHAATRAFPAALPEIKEAINRARRANP
jgi:hypothetical protein